MRPSEVHPNEPTLEELKKIHKELKASAKSEDKDKKLEAIDSQIKRHEELV